MGKHGFWHATVSLDGTHAQWRTFVSLTPVFILPMVGCPHVWSILPHAKTNKLFSCSLAFSHSQERSCVSVVIYIFPQSGNRVCFSCVLGSLIMFWGCCLPHALLAMVSNYVLGPLCIRSEPLLVCAISFCDCIKEQCVVGFWMLDGC